MIESVTSAGSAAEHTSTPATNVDASIKLDRPAQERRGLAFTAGAQLTCAAYPGQVVDFGTWNAPPSGTTQRSSGPVTLRPSNFSPWQLFTHVSQTVLNSMSQMVGMVHACFHEPVSMSSAYCCYRPRNTSYVLAWIDSIFEGFS